MDGLRNVHCSKLFFSCDGLDADGGITTAFIEEARMTRVMMDSFSEVVLLSDSSKIVKVGYGKICKLDEIDTLITDSDIPDNFRTRLESLGVRVISQDLPPVSLQGKIQMFPKGNKFYVKLCPGERTSSKKYRTFTD